MIAANVAVSAIRPSQVWAAWGGDPFVVATLFGSTFLYGRGYARVRRRSRSTADRRAACFGAGILAAAIALVSPLDAMSESLFSAHMVQHLLLMMIAAPLFVLGRPALTILAALPPRLRARAARTSSRIAGSLPARALRRPAVAWGVFAIVLWGWHLPTLYEDAVLDPWLHALEHASFLLTSMLVWSIALDRRRREIAAFGRALLLFASAVQSGLLGAVLLFASAPLFPVHGSGPAAWGLTPLQDQQLAGALMWIPPAAIHLPVIATILVRAFRAMDDRTDAVRGRERAVA